MFIDWIHIENYRNIEDVVIDFHEKFNYIVGENAIGKTNFLALMTIITEALGFKETDFMNPLKPIRITMSMALSENEAMELLDKNTQRNRFIIEQLVQEVYPRLYSADPKMEELPLAVMRKIFYINHHSADMKDLESISPSIYRQMYHDFQEKIKEIDSTPNATDTEFHFFRESEYKETELYIHLRRMSELMGYSFKPELYTPNNLRLLLTVTIKLLTQIYVRYKSFANNLEGSVIVDKNGKRFLPIMISVDEPEKHLSPYLQRTMLSFYSNIMFNQEESFLKFLKLLFNLDGVRGQLFVVTHSTDALVDDYRYIIRLYRTRKKGVCAACGSTFNFSKELEKHLIMHFPEVKEALYARCVIIVEGETERGCFVELGRTLGINFDYYGICLINARGEASISKLSSLLRRFAIPTVVLYDRDVMEKYDRNRSRIRFTDEICFEMDLVKHVIGLGHRNVLDGIIADLTDNAKGVVTKDMLKRGLAKLKMTHAKENPRALKNISDRRPEDLLVYYFSWFYGHKGIIVGRTIGKHLTAEDVPPSFRAVIEKARSISLHVMEEELFANGLNGVNGKIDS